MIFVMNEQAVSGHSSPALFRKTGILVHGYNLFADGWDSVAWGVPPDQIGRVPMGVYLALTEHAEVLVFGSGASTKNGFLESEATAHLMRGRFDSLNCYSLFGKGLPEMKHPDFVLQQKQRIESILHLDKYSRNTKEEIEHAGRVFIDHNVDRVILVSSPTHLPRCLRDACTIFEGTGDLAKLRNGLYAAPSVTGYPGRATQEVTIFEPPHRPDRSTTDVASVVARVHDIPESGRERFVKRLDQLLSEFKV